MSTETISPKIIQRPAGIQLKKRPVEEKVSSRRSDDDTSGAIKVLAKKGVIPSTATNESCLNHLEKEEKNDDPRMTTNATIVNNTEVSAAEISTAAADEWNPLEEVDSALLTALCDAKERKALVRLESILVDFMKDPSLTSIDVGGAFNSIVVGLRPQQQQQQTSSSEDQTPPASVGSGGVTNEEDATTFVPSQSQGVQDLLSQYQRGIRQTSFQRLILHRLADRFNIVREQINNINPNPAPPVTNNERNTGERGLVDVGANNNNNNNYINNSWSPQQQQQNTYPLGLIRLIKNEESCIPDHLLINLDLSLLVNYKNPRARNFAPNNNNSNNNAEEGMRTLSDNMNAASLDNVAGVTSSMPGPKKPNKKMVIMKRNSSSNTSGSGEGSGNGKREGRSRRKKLEDREKAYEEARARIFGKEEKKDAEGGISDEKGESAAAGQENLSPLNSCHSSFSTEENTDAPPADSEGADVSNGSHIVPSQLISGTTPKIRSASPSPEPPGSAAPGSLVETEGEQKQGQQSKTKAVYRNRQQEENDPDFRRRSAYVPAAAMGVTSSGHMPPGVPYNMVNPYAVNPYSAVPGQHVMMQQQPPHFYPHPGQVTPQDPKSMHYPGYTQPRVFYPAQQPQQQPQSQSRSTEQQAQPSVVTRKTSDSSQGAPQVNDARPPPQKPSWGPNARLEVKPSEPAVPTIVAPTKKAAPAKITTPPPAKSEKREIKTTLYKDEDFPALG